MTHPRTLFQKIWDQHVVMHEPGSPAVLYIDLHLVHEVTSPQAFSGLRSRGVKVRRPRKTIATVDHAVPTLPGPQGDPYGRMVYADTMARLQVQQLYENCREFDINLFGLDDPNQGIVHVVGPEQGYTQPGMTIVCGDSHTATHGAFGALAFGIGTSEVEHVLATQCLLQQRPKTCEVRVEGSLGPGVTSKDIILALIQQIGVHGGVGYVLEYTGEAIRQLDMEARMTLCNMSIEAGARAGMIAPDETTFNYLANRPAAPQGADWVRKVEEWRQLASDDGAQYDRLVVLDASALQPRISFGTNPAMNIPVGGAIPRPEEAGDASHAAALEKALVYMGLEAGKPLAGHPVDVVFIGSCTNGRISDLRQAAGMLQGRKVAPGVRVLIVPGSQQVKRQAEAEGLNQVFQQAGAEWREPGCSMCIAMNGDQLEPGQYSVSTSNRNFEGRQGKGGRTFLASPLSAAAAALEGRVADPRKYLSS